MRPTNTQERTVESTLGGKQVSMGFYKGAQQKLMSILTRMYSDLPGTLIREYAVNALDSHVEAGNPEPILVYLPNLMNQTLRIVDRGIGMSPEDVEFRFSQYGYSSKEHTNDQTGYLGLGSKSALAYTESFSVIAVKNGIKTVAIIRRGEKGDGVCNIDDTFSTTEPDGVTIKIPVKSIQPFESAAANFFRWWAPGTVLVNDAEPIRPTVELDLGDGMAVYTNGLDNDYVIMGGIAYPVGQRLTSHLPYGYRAVAEVPMGSVEFVPSREALEFTDLTTRTVNEYATRIKQGVRKVALDAIEAAPNRREAINAARKWGRLVGGYQELKWRGESIPTSTYHLGYAHTVKEFRPNSSRNAFTSTSYLDVHAIDNTLFVTDFAVETLTPTIRTKLRKYITDNNLNITKVYLSPERPDVSWFEDSPEVSYDDIKAIKLPRTPKQSLPTEQFRIYKGGQSEYRKVEADDDNFVLFSPAYEDSLYYIAREFPEVTFITMGKNRWGKFTREFDGDVLTFEEFLLEQMKISYDSFTLSDLLAAGNHVWDVREVQKLDQNNVKDEDVVKLIEAAKTKYDIDKVEKYHKLRRWHNTNLEKNAPKMDDSRAVELLETLDKYPFLRYASNVEPKHAEDYINALWAQEQE